MISNHAIYIFIGVKVGSKVPVIFSSDSDVRERVR